MTHEVTLSNGRKLALIERDNELAVAQVDPDDTPWFICAIVPDGVLTYPNSGDATQYLTEGLKK